METRRLARLRRVLAVAAVGSVVCAGAVVAQDLKIERIDTTRLQCGGCPSTVDVVVSNSGRALSGGYNVFVELKVTPGGGPYNARQFKEQVSGFAVGSQTFSFDRVDIQCSQYNANLEAKVYVVGGNFREGNTRNNEQRVALAVQNRCGGGGGAGGPTAGGGNGGNADRPDLDAGSSRPMTLNWSPSGRQQMTFYVRNKGRGSAGASRAKLVLTHPDGRTTTEETVSIPAMGVNRSERVRFDFELPECGSGYSYELVVDEAGDVDESEEGNNRASSSLGFRNCPSTAPTGGGGSSTGGGGSALGAPDLRLEQIDTTQLRCGGCPSTVKVTVNNTGRDISGGYNVFLELKVTPGGGPANSRSFKQQFSGFRSGSQTFTFDDVDIQCSQYNANLEAKVYVVGGSFREGNTRNNDKRVAVAVQNRCR